MLPALFDDERRMLLRIALALCAASLTIIPFTVQVTQRAGAATAPTQRPGTDTAPQGAGPRAPEALAFPPLELVRDPFVPGRSMVESAGDAILRAVVTGAQPRALIERGTKVVMVGVGDRIGDSTVRAIDGHGVRLSDGAQLTLTPARP